MPGVAQSGIPSAVGLCLESQWGQVPLTAGTPPLNTIGITGTNPHRFCIVEPGGGFAPQPEVIAPHDEIDGNLELGRTILDAKAYPGSFSVKADAENLYYLLLGLFGKDIQSGGGGVFTHVFTPGIYVPSFTVEEIFGDKTYGRVTSGVHVERLELDIAKILAARWSGYGMHQVPNSYQESAGETQYDFGSQSAVIPTAMGGDGTKAWIRTASPTYIDVAAAPGSGEGNGPFVFAGMGYGGQSGFGGNFLKVDDSGTYIDILEGSMLTIERAIDRRMVGGSGYDIGACIGNQIVVSGRLNCLFRDSTFPKASLKHSKVALNLAIQGSLISGGSYYTLDIYLPDMRFTRTGPDIPGAAMMINGEFVCRYNATLGASVQIKLKNTFDHTSLAGNAPSAGGLGGWSAA